jgi:hypothetical protein
MASRYCPKPGKCPPGGYLIDPWVAKYVKQSDTCLLISDLKTIISPQGRGRFRELGSAWVRGKLSPSNFSPQNAKRTWKSWNFSKGCAVLQLGEVTEANINGAN